MISIDNPVLYNIWKDRYCKNGESLENNLRRVAKYLANNEEEEQEFFDVMANGYFFPAGRTMSNAGVGRDLTLNNCFILPAIKDDLRSIFDSVTLNAITHQKGGGCGTAYSNLRPRGIPTANEAFASGPVSFMDVFNAQTATILQSGRRGANLGCLSVYHPDIEEFIYAKSKDEKRLNHFNISVLVDDEFMKAVEDDNTIFLHWPIFDENNQKLTKDKWDSRCTKEVSARELWDKIMELAYNNGEPGILQFDTMNKDNNLWYIESITGTNPCGEYLAGTVYGVNPITGEKLNSEEYGGACNLGSVFLHNFVKHPFTKSAYLDKNALSKAIRTGVKMLDNVIDINKFPSNIYKNYQDAFRTIGFGTTGLADMLAMLGKNYTTQEAINYVDDLYNFITKEVYRASISLAKEKGSFPFLNKEKFIQSNFIKKHCEIDDEWRDIAEEIAEYGIRNAKLNSIAPTGTLSLTFGNNCSSGIEPIFSLSYERKVKMGGQDESDAQIVEMTDYAYGLYKTMIVRGERVDFDEKDIFVTAMNMTVDEHIDMLAKIAFHTDMSVSKTINVPTDYSFEDTKNIYMKCWKLGIKGCTIFRPNEIRKGILYTEDSKKEEQKEEIVNTYDTIVPVSRKTIGTTHGKTYCKKTACGTLYITINCDDNDNIVETFVHTSKGGICQANVNAINRMISLNMRSGVKVDEIIDQLRGINCQACAKTISSGIKLDGISCPDIISRTIKEFKESLDGEPVVQKPIKVENTEVKLVEQLQDDNKMSYKAGSCPECGAELEAQGE